jgi:mannose-6-phosphate isomerase
MHPLKFIPIYKPTVWGGQKIKAYKASGSINPLPAENKLDEMQPIGESWELSGVKGNESVVSEGPLAGKTIKELIASYKAELVGKANYERYGEEFPLLIKFIDAQSDLSIQVHPDDEMAGRRHNGSKGKTEMWYLLDAEEDTYLYSGFSQEISPEEYEKRVLDGSITEVLARHQVTPGDVFFLPAGRVHAICSGCFVAEIQQTSDITYRIYDYGRLGLDGKPRQLHIEEAKEAIDYKVDAEYRSAYQPCLNQEVQLASCPYFTTHLLEIDKPYQKNWSDSDGFLIVICLSGKATLKTDGSIQLSQGETALVPASAEWIEFIPEGPAKFLLSHNL